MIGFNLFRAFRSSPRRDLDDLVYAPSDDLPFRSSPRRDHEDLVHAPWDDLPDGILDLIIQRLDLVSRIRFSVVSKTWRSAAKKARPHRQPLWLILPRERGCKKQGYYDLCEGTIHNLILPESLQGRDCYFTGSSKGWLIVEKSVQCFLFNPITRLQFQLPPTTKILDDDDNVDEFPRITVLFTVDASPSIVGLLYNKVLALWTPGDDRWTMIERLADADDIRFKDILLSDNSKVLYALVSSYYLFETNGRESTEVAFQTRFIRFAGHDIVLKLIPNVPPSGNNATDIQPLHDQLEHPLFQTNSLLRSFFIEHSNGNVLIVHKVMDTLGCMVEDNEDDEDDGEHLAFNGKHCYHRTQRFEVFEVQFRSKREAIITRLRNLGDRAIFAQGDSSSIPAANFDRFQKNCDGFQKNCIYFLDDILYDDDDASRLLPLSRESGVFYLDDGRIERFFPNIDTRNMISTMLWFLPNIIT